MATQGGPSRRPVGLPEMKMPGRYSHCGARMVPVPFKFPQLLVKDTDANAKQLGVSRSEYARKAITHLLEEADAHREELPGPVYKVGDGPKASCTLQLDEALELRLDEVRTQGHALNAVVALALKRANEDQARGDFARALSV